MTQRGISRRRLVQSGAIALAAAPMLVPARAFGANEKITMGCIGVGWQGGGNMNQFLRQDACRVVAVCDVDRNHLEGAKKRVDGHYKDSSCAAFSDYRELLARQDIDTVMLALPDHQHGVIAVAAANAGKDIYGEKPLAHSFADQKAIVDAVHKNKRIWQTGSWQRSVFNFQWGCELVQNGFIGKVTRIEVGLPAGHHDFGRTGNDKPNSDPPAELNYPAWIGPAHMIPYNVCRLHKNWRWHYNSGGGQLMDWIGHHNDIAHWGMKWDNTGPLEVKATGEFPSYENVWNTAKKYRIECKYPGDVEVVIAGGHGDIGGGTKWIGPDGWVHVNRGKFNASNPEWTKKGFERGPISYEVSKNHYQNFLDCVASRKPAVAHVDAAHRSATPGHLGHIAMVTGRTIRWDPEREQIVGDDAAAKMLTQDIRDLLNGKA